MDIRNALTPINHAKGRSGLQVAGIVLHISEGSLDSMRGWFRNPAAGVSAHYGIGRGGEVEQYVLEEDTAFHAGKLVRPTAALVLERPDVNPNLFTVGIEHAGRATEAPTEAQLLSSAELVADIARRHRIPLDRKHVIGHREIRADKSCPGKIDPDEVVRLAKGDASPRPAAPRTGDRRWSEYLGEHIILTRYESDTKWAYVRESLLRRMGAAGAVPWSQMPPERGTADAG